MLKFLQYDISLHKDVKRGNSLEDKERVFELAIERLRDFKEHPCRIW